MKHIVLSLCIVALLVSCVPKNKVGSQTASEPVQLQTLPVAVLYTQPSGYPDNKYTGGAVVTVMYPGDFDAPSGRSKISAWIESTIRTLRNEKNIRAFVIMPAVTGSVTAVQEARKTYPDILVAALEPENNIYEIEAECDFVLATDYKKNAYGSVVTAKKMGAEKLLVPDFSKAPKNSLTYFYNNALKQSAEYEAIDVALYSAKGLDYSLKNTAVLYVPQSSFSEEKIIKAESSLAFIPCFPLSYKPHLDALFKHYGADGSWLPAYSGRMLGIINKYYITINPYVKMLVPGYPAELALVEVACNELSKLLEIKNYKRTSIARFVNTKTVLEILKKIDSSMGWEASFFIDPETGIRSMRTILVSEDFYQIGKGFIPITRQRVPAQVTGK